MPSLEPKVLLPHPRNFFCEKNLIHVWKKSGETDNKAPGYDGITFKKFEDNLDNQIKIICKKLNEDEYHFKSLRAEFIPKGNNQYRTICVPTIRDRLVQRLILALIYSKKVKTINIVSYGIRGRGIQSAINQAVEKRNKSPWVIKTDIISFFNNIDRLRLITSLEKKFSGTKKLLLLPLLKKIVNAEIYFKNNEDKKKLEKNGIIFGKGLRQGMPLSPFLADFFLEKFDKFIIKKSINAIRYVDDIIVFCNSRDECQSQLNLLKIALKELSLEIPEVNSTRSKTCFACPNDPVTFLGIELYRLKNGNYGKKIPKPNLDILLSESELISELKGLSYPKIIELFENKKRGLRGIYKDTTNFDFFWGNYLKIIDKIKKNLLKEKLGPDIYEKLKPHMFTFLGI